MQRIIMNLAGQDIEIQSVDGEIAEGCSGSVELQIINAPDSWTSGKVWATFTKGDIEISHLTTKVNDSYVTDVPDKILEDDRNMGIFVWYLGNQNYVETRRVLRLSIAETGKIPNAVEEVKSEEASEVMQMLKNMETMYEIVEGAEADRNQKYETAEADRYDKYYKAEGLTEEEIASDDFESRQTLYLKTEAERNNSYHTAEKGRDDLYIAKENERQSDYNDKENKRDSMYRAAEDNREKRFGAAESERNSAESVRQTNEENRQIFEGKRRIAESSRKNAETVRQSNETARQEAETQRQLDWGNGGTKEQTLLETFLSAIYNSTDPVLRAESDVYGNKIHLTYATIAALNKILIPGSETIVNKAENDDHGDKIRLTYAKKTDIVTSYNDLTDKPFSNVNWLDIDSLYGREKDGIYKVSGKVMSGTVGMGNSSSYMLVMTNVSGNVLQTCQYLIHSDGKSQYRLGTGTGIEDWSEWKLAGGSDINVVHNIDNISGDDEFDAIPSARAVKIHVGFVQNDTIGYIDRAIGDVETSLENIIAKYGLGGESE